MDCREKSVSTSGDFISTILLFLGQFEHRNDFTEALHSPYQGANAVRVWFSRINTWSVARASAQARLWRSFPVFVVPFAASCPKINVFPASFFLCSISKKSCPYLPTLSSQWLHSTSTLRFTPLPSHSHTRIPVSRSSSNSRSSSKLVVSGQLEKFPLGHSDFCRVPGISIDIYLGRCLSTS
jgi:hypothetical protein